MVLSQSPLPRGRQLQAAHNDQLILTAARAVFVADPHAPIATVAERAGVGIAALYRRYASKEDLLRTLCANGLASYISETRSALAEHDDPWATFAAWMGRVVAADTNSLVQKLAGTFKPTEAMFAEAALAAELTGQLVKRTKAAGALPADVESTDIAVLFEMVASVRIGDEDRTARLRQRYLALLLAALRAGCPGRLPGPAPSSEELETRWSSAAGGPRRLD